MKELLEGKKLALFLLALFVVFVWVPECRGQDQKLVPEKIQVWAPSKESSPVLLVILNLNNQFCVGKIVEVRFEFTNTKTGKKTEKVIRNTIPPTSFASFICEWDPEEKTGEFEIKAFRLDYQKLVATHKEKIYKKD